MKKSIFIFSLLTISVLSSFTQQQTPYISFENESHNFGTIAEEKGSATHNFKFVNTGNEPLVLTNVRASCGCTTPKWTREPVLPGKDGVIVVSYNPAHRPGVFNKSITVTSNADNGTVVLRINGNVTPKEKTMEDIYRYDMNGIRTTTNHVAFNQVTFGEKAVKEVEVINTSDKNITIGFENVPKHITIKAVPTELKPNGKGKIEVTYDTKIKNDWGFVIDRVYVLLNGTRNTQSRLSISANIQDDFSTLTPEQRANAPVISFDETEYNFGTINQHASASYKYTFINNGKSNLIIRKVKASCGCTAVQPAKNIIAPGEKSSIKATFNAGTRKGKQQKTITITSNDPEHPTVLLKLVGNVEPNAE